MLADVLPKKGAVLICHIEKSNSTNSMFTRFQALNQIEFIKPFAEFVGTSEATHTCELTLLFLMVMASVLFLQMSQAG